ncbi:unnamed protein product [Owenia fusiformis]|uniref:Uncharacterized protein n=1 Tax=Owenia fusiformis TaxID=6347 RepID=A0A8S4N031_OWEFU|nr:unnamed protein product [Owenia fusiformis]
MQLTRGISKLFIVLLFKALTLTAEMYEENVDLFCNLTHMIIRVEPLIPDFQEFKMKGTANIVGHQGIQECTFYPIQNENLYELVLAYNETTCGSIFFEKNNRTVYSNTFVVHHQKTVETTTDKHYKPVCDPAMITKHITLRGILNMQASKKGFYSAPNSRGPIALSSWIALSSALVVSFGLSSHEH